MKPEEVLTEQEKDEIRKKVRKRTIAITRWLCAVITLVLILLSWYGAEMLLYGYSQPSIVKVFIAICMSLGISGSMQKEMIANDRKKDFLEGFAKAIQRKTDHD